MGALPNDHGEPHETPAHRVWITKPFYMFQYPCTQELYDMVTNLNPSHFKAPRNPVENVSWWDAIIFCNLLSKLEDLELCYTLPSHYAVADCYPHEVKWKREAKGYRLPTEAGLANAKVKSGTLQSRDSLNSNPYRY